MTAPVETVDIRSRNLNTTDFLTDLAFFINLYKKAGIDSLHAGYFVCILSSVYLYMNNISVKQLGFRAF